MNEMLSAAVARCEPPVARSARPEVVPRLTARSAVLPGARIVVYDSLAAAEPPWRAFEPTADCSVFQNFDYLAAWQRHIGTRERVTPAIVVLERDDHVLAILPLARARGTILRRLVWLGQDPSDYLGPLLARDPAPAIPPHTFTALWNEIRALLQTDPRFRHDLIDFRKMPATVGGRKNPFAALPVLPHPSDAYAATLTGDWDSFYRARRSAKSRRQDRSKLKRLAEFGVVRMLTPDRRREITRAVDTLLAQKAVTFARKGIGDRFRNPGYRDFYHDLALNPRTRNLAHVSELKVGDAAAAINFGLEYRGCYSLCLVSYDEGFSRFSPGAIHLNELFHRAIDRGLHEFDFLVGFQRLKREWSDRRMLLYDHFAGTTARGTIAALVLRFRSRLKRLIKTTPTLWNTYTRLRALRAALPGPARDDD